MKDYRHLPPMRDTGLPARDVSLPDPVQPMSAIAARLQVSDATARIYLQRVHRCELPQQANALTVLTLFSPTKTTEQTLQSIHHESTH